jgi:hypothetical protein
MYLKKSQIIEKLENPKKKKSAKKSVKKTTTNKSKTKKVTAKKSKVKKPDPRTRTRSARADDLLKKIMDGPTFNIPKEMFTECLFRRDFGQYISCEMSRHYKEWAVNNLLKDLKILIVELQEK